MAKYLFLRHGEVYERRVGFNKIERHVNNENKNHYFTVREVQRVLCDNAISVTPATVRHWIRTRLLPAHKRGQNNRWWITQRGFKTLIETMHFMNEKEFDYVNDPLELRPQEVRIRRQRRRELPDRNRDGSFKKKCEYDHRQLYGRLG